MQRRTLTCLVLLTLFLFSSVNLFTSNVGTPLLGEPATDSSGGTQIESARSPTAPPPPEGPTWDGSEYLYQGLGQTLPSQEFSYGPTAILGVTDLDFGETATGQIDIPQGWTGYYLTASVYNLFDKISHIAGNTRNGNFESGTTSPNYWVESKRGMSGGGIAGLSWNWGTDWGETDKGINIWANTSGYPWQANLNLIEYIGWTQTIDLNRIDPTYAWLSFDVRFYDDNVHGRDDDDEMAVYAEVGGAERIFVCWRYCPNAWRQGWQFYNINFSLTPDELQSWTSDTINVTLGMTVDFDWTINNYFAMDFDNVELIVRGKASPTANGLQLRLNSSSSWVNPTYGSGTISLAGTWGPYPSDDYVVASWTTVSAISRNVDFNYTLTLYIKRSGTTEAQTGPEGSTFLVKHGLNASWTAWFFADFYSTYYTNYNFTIKKPAGGTWSLSSVTDPNLNSKTAEVLAQSNATYWCLPASLITAFGWWKFTFTSFNQIESVSGLQSLYRINPRSPSILSITVTFESVTSGEVNLTIYNAQHQHVYSAPTGTVTGGTHPFTVDFDDGDLFPAGTYDLCISYDDNVTLSQVGFYRATFDIEHDSSLTPETTPLTVGYNDGGFFYPRVAYNDIETSGSPFIGNTSGSVTVTGQVSGRPLVTFRQVGSLYQAIVPDTYAQPGDHNLAVTADDPFYDAAQTTIVLRVRSSTTLSSPTPGYTAYYLETFMLQVFYEDNNGTGISGAASWFTTPGWSGTSITPGGSAGWYNIQADSDADGRIIGTHTLTVTVTDPSAYYQSRTLQFTIVVRGRNTLLTSTTPSSVPYGATARFSITLSDLDGGAPPNNSTNKLHLSLWRGGVRWTSPEASIIYGGANGKWNISVDTGFLPGVGDYTFEVRFEWYHISSDNSPFYGNRTVDVTVSARLVGTSITYDPPNPIPINDDADITIYYQIDDPIYFPISRIFGIVKADVTVLLNGTNLGTGFDWDPQLDGSYILTIYSSDLNQVAVWEIKITINKSGDSYQGASRTFLFNVRQRLTQVIVDPPTSTPYQQNTPITFSWFDLDAGSTPIALSSVYQVTISGYGSPQTFTNPGTWTVTLVTNTWTPGIYSLKLLITGDDPPGIYNQTKSAVTVRIRIHYTGVTVQPPNPTPWGRDTLMTVLWTDLDIGGNVPIIELVQVVVSDGPGGDQTFFSLSFTLDTDTWSIGEYILNVTVYARTSPSRSYNDAWGSVTVVIRIHRVEVVVPTPSPRAWGQDTAMSVTWKDLDTKTTIPGINLDSIVVSDGPGGDQTFFSLSFILDTDAWGVGEYLLNVTVYPDMTPQLYEIASYLVTITIRAHYVSVTVDPPAQTPWGADTSLTIAWRDVDMDALISDTGLDNVTITGGPGGNQVFFTLTPTLSTSSWSVNSYSLTVWVYGNASYYVNSGPVTVVIRGHQTQTVVTPPQQTPFGFDTAISVSWLDLDLGSIDVPGGNLLSVTVSGGPGGAQVFGSLSFTLVTNTWSVNTYILTVTVSPSNANYLGSSSQTTIIIRIHYTSITVQTPEPTPWGLNTPLTVTWTDLDTGGPVPGGQLLQVVVSNCPVGGDQPFGSLSFTLVTDTWALSSGYSLIVTVYATTGPRSYSDAIGSVLVAIRTHRVNVVVTGPAPVPEGGRIFISIEWSDIDTLTPIGTGVLDYVIVTKTSGPLNSPGLPYTNWTHLEFYIDATGWDTGTFKLNVTVYSSNPNYADGWGPVNIVIRVHSITADVDPIPRVPFGNDINITLRVDDSDDAIPLPENHISSVVISGGPSTITLDSSNWWIWVENGTFGVGTYLITLDVSGWALSTYNLQINVYTSSSYGNGVVYTRLIVRALAISFTYQSPPVVPWGEDGLLIVTYIVSDDATQDGNPIEPPGITINIATLTQGVHFDWTYWTNGKYNITFYSSYLTSVQTYQFDITISKSAEYSTGVLNAVPLTVRSLYTWLHPTDVPITPFGDHVLIDVEYIVLDGESSLFGQPIHTGSEILTITGLDGFNPTSVTWQWVGALSIYRINISATDITAIQAYKIMISISGSGAGYDPDIIPSLTFNVRTVFTALAVTPVDAQAYLDNFTIQITYTVNDPDSSRNGRGIDGQASIIELVEYPGLFTVIPLGNGIYNIIINSTGVGAPGSYLATITTAWTQSPPPYAIQTRQVTLFVTERPTRIRNTIGEEYGYLDEILINFTYSDLIRLEWILNTSYGGGHIFISVYNNTPATPVLIPNDAWYVTEIIGGTHAFQLHIQANYFLRVNTFFDFLVNVTWQPATAPYFQFRIFEFRAYVVGQRTNVIFQPSTGPTPYYSNINIVFRFVTEQGAPINQDSWPLVAVSLLCEQVPSFGIQGLDWDYTFTGSGFYEIWIDSTRLIGIGSYTFYVNVTYPGGADPFFESQYNEPVTRLVRYIDTLLTYIDPGPLYYGDDLTLTVRYWDRDNDVPVPNIPPINFTLTGGTYSGPTPLGGGWWEFIVATSGIGAGGEFTISVYANQSYYYWQSLSVPVYIYEVPLQITLDTPPIIDRYYGQLDPAWVNVTITIGAGSLKDTEVLNALVQAIWDEPTLTFINNTDGTYSCDIGTLWNKGRYTIEIRASLPGYYSNDSIFIIYTITAGPSILDVYGRPSTSFYLYAGDLYFIAVNFTTPDGTPLTGAEVTWSSADLTPSSGDLSETFPGIYNASFSSLGYGLFIYTISVKASLGGNVQSQTLTFQIDVRYTPAKIQPADNNYFIPVEYSENFTLIFYFNDTLNNQPIPSELILARWDPLPGGNATLNPMAGGFYNYTFPATLLAGLTYPLYLTYIGSTAFDCPPTTITIQITPRLTSPVDQANIVSVREDWNKTISILQVPVGDWLYIYLNYTDADGIPILYGEGIVTVGDVGVSGVFYFDASKGLYVVTLNASDFGRGTWSLRVTVSRTNFESSTYATNFEVIQIPTALTVTEIDEVPVVEPGSAYFYIGSPLTIHLFLNDTWHNEGVEGATLTLPRTLVDAGFVIVPLEDGYYEIQGTWNLFSLTTTSIALTVTAEKTEPLRHETAQLSGWVLTFSPPATLLITVYGGIGAAVMLIVVLMTWLLWVRVFSIPWEVRRMRSLAKTVEKDENFKLSKKDLKRFHARELTLKDKVTTAMATVGVAATPAMMPAIETVEEVTATEEDIMGELDKIPGLGPEEKGVLAEEMRKIPRKDRIWFLDDLRKQMGQRRMDFLTKRELGEVTEVPEAIPPTEAPPEVPLDKVKAAEPPPPEKALTEDRTAPTVLPPEFQPPPVDPAVEAEINRELAKIPGLSAQEKKDLLDHLKYLSKEERKATYISLRQSADRED
ncbi:MAG: hypothetical protein ACFE89_10180 [Candidatus Hodarchaeota archaeon]